MLIFNAAFRRKVYHLITFRTGSIIRMAKEKDLSPETKSAQALRQIDAMTGGLMPAIHPSSTFVRDENYQLIDDRHSYGRAENPDYIVAEKVLAELEGAAAALLFSSGMAAAMAVVQSLNPGDHIVAPKVMYWGLRNWLIKFCDHWGLGLDLFDAADPDALAKSESQKDTFKLLIVALSIICKFLSISILSSLTMSAAVHN